MDGFLSRMLPIGGGLPNGDGGTSMMGGGGVMGAIQRAMQQNPSMMGGVMPSAAPSVPADGAMQPTIGPGAAPAAPAAPPAPTGMKAGLPAGGLLGLMRGQSPQGILGILQQMSQNGQKVPVPSIPGTEGMQAAGMLSPAFNVQGGPMNILPGG